MNFDFFDFLSICGNVLNLFFGSSSGSTNYNHIPEKKKERKYVIEKISTALSAFSAVFFFFVFRNPPVSDHYIQSLVIISILALAVSLVIFFVLNVLEKYYFKSVFQWLFFSLSVVSFCISVILWIYFKSGMF